MSANPALVRTHNGELVPAPFPAEHFVLKRSGVQLDLDGVRTASGKWSVRGFLFLSNVRMVFVAEKPDPSGLAGFDFPLVYLRNDQLNQPIFFCNNLTGQVWPAVEGGGPSGGLPPHSFTVYFKEGGIGTFYPLYYSLTCQAKEAFEAAAARSRDATADLPASVAQSLAARAFVDPGDPTTIFLTQPLDESQRLHHAPRYAANYGQDEKYEAGERAY